MEKISQLFGLVLVLSFLTACGGGGGSSDALVDSGEDTTALSDTSSLAGTWIQKFCAAGAGVSDKQRNVYTAVNSSTVTWAFNLYRYAGTSCAGSGASFGAPSDYGSVVFSSMVSKSGKKYYRGEWSPPSTSTSKIIFAIKASGIMCIFSDTTPTSFPTTASIDAYVAIVDEQVCYEKI
ncbi:MAG: hypothetical protein V4654_00035 [Bdellovibrionota bacterium]